jgi:hypothetical protein
VVLDHLILEIKSHNKNLLDQFEMILWNNV